MGAVPEDVGDVVLNLTKPVLDGLSIYKMNELL